MSVEESGPTDMLTGHILPHTSVELPFEKQRPEPDDDIKIAKAVLILDLIYCTIRALSNAGQDHIKSKQGLLSSLDESLPKTLSRDLNISWEVNALTVRCLKILITGDLDDWDAKNTTWSFEGLTNWFLKSLVMKLAERGVLSILESSECPRSEKTQRRDLGTPIDMKEPHKPSTLPKEEDEPEEPSGCSESQNHLTQFSDESEEKPQEASVSPEEIEPEKALDFPKVEAEHGKAAGVEENPEEYSTVPQCEKQKQEVLNNSGCEDEPQESSASLEFEEEPEEGSGSFELEVEVSVTPERKGEKQEFSTSLELKEGIEELLASPQSEKQQQEYLLYQPGVEDPQKALAAPEEVEPEKASAMTEREEEPRNTSSTPELEEEPEDASLPSQQSEKQQQKDLDESGSDSDLEETQQEASASPECEEEPEEDSNIQSEKQELEDSCELVHVEELQETSTSPTMEEEPEEDITPSECEQESKLFKDLEKNKASVLLIIETIADHIYIEANMVPEYHTSLLMALFEYIWDKVQGEDLRVSDKSLKKIDRTIHRALCEKLGGPCNVLFLLQYSEEPVVADRMVDIVKKLLIRPTKKAKALSRFFSSLGWCVKYNKLHSHESTTSSDKFEHEMTDVDLGPLKQ